MFARITGKKAYFCTIGLILALSAPSFADDTTALHHATHGGDYPDYPTVNYGTGDQAKRIKHGEYLVKAGDCIACHTEPGGKPFAGGLAIKTPFGTIFSQNITPDKKTGIGSWSDKDFLRAMKHGVSPDGSYYFPVFPYPYFNKMTDEDVLAIKAYLFAMPPIEKENKPVEMGIPFRWRFMQLGWRMLFFNFYKGELKPDPTKSAAWNRGRYIVEGPGHCSMCHTPMNFLGAPKRKYYLTGGMVDGFYAPNISSTGLKDHTIKEVVNVFLEDRAVTGGKIAAKPMLEVNHDSLDYLTKEDLDAVALYIKSVVSKVPPTPKRTGKVDLSVGKEIYNKYCVGCHATGAGGAFKYGDVAAWQPLVDKGLNTLYKNAIAGIGNMPPKGNCATCSTAEIQATVDYIVQPILSGDKQAATTVSKPTVKQPKATLALGKKVYTKVCSVCHDQGQLGAPKIGDKQAWKKLVAQNMDVLINRAIKGYKWHPARGACYKCSDTDIIAAVKYMVQESSDGDYRLW